MLLRSSSESRPNTLELIWLLSQITELLCKRISVGSATLAA
jgi:hypothetical protein